MAIVNNTSTSPAEQASELGVEIWRDVQGYEGRYKVSNLGRVKSLVDNRGKRREKMLRLQLGTGGYLGVTLCKNGEETYHRIHRLVLRAFKRARYVGQNEGRHLNGVRTDNRLCNLAFGTSKENSADMVIHGTDPRGECNGYAKLTDEQVQEIRQLYATDKYFLREIGEMFGVCRASIGRIVNRKQWAHIS